MCHLQSINHGEFINEGRNSKLCKHIRLIVKQIQIRVTPFSAFFQISGHTIVGQASHLSDIRTEILSAASSWESTNTRVFSVFFAYNDGDDCSGLDIFITWHSVCDKHRIHMP